MPDIAMGTKVFKRTRKLEQLLKSVPADFITHVYVADDGDFEERTHIYEEDWPFELTVFDLEYDAGIGKGRQKIVQELSEPFFLLVDSDHTIPSNVEVLYNQLVNLPSIGGIGGSIAEPEHGRLFQVAKNLYEIDGGLVRTAESNEIEFVEGLPFARFDFIPNAALFRRECVEDYCWDPEIVMGADHIDFYVGHMRTTEWEFGVSPTVYFGHYPGGDVEYESARQNKEKIMKYKDYFLDKWDYKFDRFENSYWYDTEINERAIVDQIKQELRNKDLKSIGVGALRSTHRLVRDDTT